MRQGVKKKNKSDSVVTRGGRRVGGGDFSNVPLKLRCILIFNAFMHKVTSESERKQEERRTGGEESQCPCSLPLCRCSIPSPFNAKSSFDHSQTQGPPPPSPVRCLRVFPKITTAALSNTRSESPPGPSGFSFWPKTEEETDSFKSCFCADTPQQ